MIGNVNADALIRVHGGKKKEKRNDSVLFEDANHDVRKYLYY